MSRRVIDLSGGGYPPQQFVNTYNQLQKVTQSIQTQQSQVVKPPVVAIQQPRVQVQPQVPVYQNIQTPIYIKRNVTPEETAVQQSRPQPQEEEEVDEEKTTTIESIEDMYKRKWKNKEFKILYA